MLVLGGGSCDRCTLLIQWAGDVAGSPAASSTIADALLEPVRRAVDVLRRYSRCS
jgi:hypothetical protein